MRARYHFGALATVMLALHWSGPATADCQGDLNADDVVNVPDLLALLGAWGPCDPPCPPCDADTNGDCLVNVPDLLALLGGWGPCPCDPSGTWGVSEPSIAYQCAFNLLVIHIDSFTFTQTETMLTVTGGPTFNSLSEVVMTGDPVECAAEQQFTVSATLPGDCTETYRLEGTFLDADRFVGNFYAEFSGANCFDCINQAWSVLVIREPDS